MKTIFDQLKPVAMGADHAGFEYKESIKSWLEENGFHVKDFGTYSADSADYADFAHPVAKEVANEDASFGILICGSANGVAMTANKHQQIRAGLCWEPEVAKLVRQHNNANVICIPARFTDIKTAVEMVDIFMSTQFEGGRHERRVNKISC